MFFKPQIKSSFVLGVTCNPDTLALLKSKRKESDEFAFVVLRTSVGYKSVYCCLSGGRLDHTGKPELTLVGLGAMEALCNLPYPKKSLIFAELKLGPTPLEDKVRRIILDAPDGAFICFFGDLSGELDGHTMITFNPTGEPIFVTRAEGMRND